MIDVHHHVIPEHLQGLHHFPVWSIESDREAMQRLGISGALLSIPASAGPQEIQDMNNWLAHLIEFDPAAYGMLAAISGRDIHQALTEIERCTDHLKADGFIMLSNYDSIYIGDDYFDPVLDMLNNRAAVVLLHPTAPPAWSKNLLVADHSVYEFPFETTRAMMDLIYRGKLKRYPNIKWIISHAGGTIPFLFYRLSICGEWNAISQSQEEIISDLQTLYYDLALSTSSAVSCALDKLTDPSRILFGTDFPLRYEAGVTNSIEQFKNNCNYSHRDILKIGRQNAKKLFPRFVSSL
ncbi:amidohydrolase family protein [Pedobacter faecalis]|uniref:amidohydrolase family protein n=1 Tax=Pedobacter faecalis TaxID=3041495 RepID=UPI00254DE423|nr:amidohydrolase family protein [Pedobacter sp. ELA7]